MWSLKRKNRNDRGNVSKFTVNLYFISNMHAVISGTVNNSPAKKIKAVKKNPQSILHVGSLPDVMGNQRFEEKNNGAIMNMDTKDKTPW